MTSALSFMHQERLMDLQLSIGCRAKKFDYTSMDRCIYGHCVLVWPRLGEHPSTATLAAHLGMSHDDASKLFFGGAPWNTVSRNDAIRAIQYFIDFGRVDWARSTPWYRAWCRPHKWRNS